MAEDANRQASAKAKALDCNEPKRTDDQVGYRKPPKASRFSKKGTSGVPKGSKKKQEIEDVAGGRYWQRRFPCGMAAGRSPFLNMRRSYADYA